MQEDSVCAQLTAIQILLPSQVQCQEATREAFVAAADRRVARQTLQVRMRYREGLTPSSTRLVFDTSTLDVEAVMDPDGRHRELVLLCHEVH